MTDSQSVNFGVLVASSIAARGLDVPEVDLVMQSCPSKDVESHFHPSGGQAERKGQGFAAAFISTRKSIS